MKAAVVRPGTPDSARVKELPSPEPGEGEALVRTLVAGLDATDREVAEGYGEAPPGEGFIVVGHEALGVVEHPAGDLTEGGLVVPIVRRPDPVPCANCAIGEWDFCSNGRFTERGIKGRHGFCAESFTEDPAFLVPVPETIRASAVLVEPLSIVEKALEQIWRIQQRLLWEPGLACVLGAGPIGLLAAMALRARGIEVMVYDKAPEGPKREVAEACGASYLIADPEAGLADQLPDEPALIIEATGYSPLALQAADAVGRNGVVCLTGVPSGSRRINIDAAALNLELVLENKVVFGTVNANRRHFEAAVGDLEEFKRGWPGLAERLITRRLPIQRFVEGLAKAPDDIKIVVDVAA